jgi:hypothetical protein
VPTTVLHRKYDRIVVVIVLKIPRFMKLRRMITVIMMMMMMMMMLMMMITVAKTTTTTTTQLESWIVWIQGKVGPWRRD